MHIKDKAMKVGDRIQVENSVLAHLGFGVVVSKCIVSVSLRYDNGEVGVYNIKSNEFHKP